MIIRHNINPDDFDYFNDYQDTRDHLMGAWNNEIREKLDAGFELWKEADRLKYLAETTIIEPHLS